MKKALLLILALVGAMVYGHSQSLENLGDGAFMKGNYGEAASYYEQANQMDPSEVLKEKIKMSKALKNEFAIIDQAIEAQDYDKANAHIDAVLKMDPDNFWALDRRQKIASNKVKKNRLVFTKGFNGRYHPFKNVDGIALGGGVNLAFFDPMLCLTASYYDYRSFPYTIDARMFAHESEYGQFGVFVGAGAGSAYIVTRHFTLDYGLGLIMNVDDEFDYFGPYSRLGATIRMFGEYMGLSYEWVHGFSSIESMHGFSYYRSNLDAHLVTLKLLLGPIH